MFYDKSLTTKAHKHQQHMHEHNILHLIFRVNMQHS